ncbi:MAG: TonB-dependent receptor plug domain-containing protein [Bacteroidota bacterium]
MNQLTIAKAFFSLILLFLTIPVNAQLSGIIVVDNTNRNPINFVVVEAADFVQISDENGFVNLTDLPKGTESLALRSFGYINKSIDLDLVDISKSPTIFLTQNESRMEEVVVVAEGNKNFFNTMNQLDLHLRPFTNSQEVLRTVPGLFIGQHAGGGKAEQIFLRGFDIDHGTDVNITVDGMPVNMVSHAHGQGYADLHFIIPEMIDRVDFNKGPYFAEKGNFTTAGFVEFKTKDYLDKNFVKIEGGQFDTYRAVTAINLLPIKGESRNQSLFFAGEAYYSNNFFDSPQNFSRFNGTLKYHGKLGRKNNLTASLTGFTSTWLASGQIPERAIERGIIGFYGAIDNTEGGSTSRYNANLELLTNLKKGGRFSNQLFYSNYNFELYSNFTFFANDSVNGDQIRQKENRDIIGYNSSYSKQYSIGRFKTETKAGVQIRYDNIDDVELSRTKNRSISISNVMLGDVNELNVGAFYSQKIEFSSKFDLTVAIRYDYFDNRYFDHLTQTRSNAQAGILSPKVNLNYKINRNVQLYLLNGRGFHSNDTRVAVQQNGKKVLPPAYGSDFGGVFKIGKKAIIQTALWYLWLDQEFIYVGDEGVVEAGGQTRRFGYDLTVRYEILSGLFADANLSLAKPRALDVPSNESYLPLAPAITSVGGITYKKQKGLNGSLRYRYMADRAANEANTIQAKGYFILDLAVNFTAKRFEAGISIQNMLNTKWKETQFLTESRLSGEIASVEEIHFTPGTPLFLRMHFSVFF